MTALFDMFSYFIEGNYGKVYKGRYTDIDGRNELVAVKVGKQCY